MWNHLSRSVCDFFDKHDEPLGHFDFPAKSLIFILRQGHCGSGVYALGIGQKYTLDGMSVHRKVLCTHWFKGKFRLADPFIRVFLGRGRKPENTAENTWTQGEHGTLQTDSKLSSRSNQQWKLQGGLITLNGLLCKYCIIVLTVFCFKTLCWSLFLLWCYCNITILLDIFLLSIAPCSTSFKIS